MTKILVFTTDWGHSSIGKAVKEVTEKHFDTEFHTIPAEHWSKIFYGLMYKFTPNLFKTVFKLSDVKILRQLFNYYAGRSYGKQLKRIISKGKPDIVINTYFAFNPSLEVLADKIGFRLINLLADPWTFSKILVSQKVENLVFDEHSYTKMKLLAPDASGLPTGWFVEKKYYQTQKLSRQSVRKSLGLNPEKFTLCITTGSEGTFNVFKIVRTFLNPNYYMQVIILCGNNKGMFKGVQTLKKLSERLGGPSIIAVPYTNEVHKYLRASDLVVGKAGPNTIFESVATLTPFFAISHISGQEDGNLDIIRRYKIGFVEERPTYAIKKLENIIENSESLYKLSKHLSNMANYCKGSGEKLVSLLKQ